MFLKGVDVCKMFVAHVTSKWILTSMDSRIHVGIGDMSNCFVHSLQDVDYLMFLMLATVRKLL